LGLATSHLTFVQFLPMQRILICDEMKFRPGSFDREGFAIEYVANMPREEILRRLPEFDGLITRSRTKVDPELLEAGSKLRVVGRGGVGVDNIDLGAASRKGIVVFNAPEANTVSAGELAITLMLAASRGVARSDKLIRAGQWDRKYLGREVREKTLGIVGLGRIGTIVANRAMGLKMNVIAFDPYISDRKFELLGVKRAHSLEALLAQIDVLTVHVPMTEETFDMIGAREIALMPAGGIVVNAARGGIINEAAIAAALEDGHLFAAGVDVFITEPPSLDNPLLGRDDVVLTAHLGANTTEAQDRVGNEILERVCAALQGDYSHGAINAPKLDASTLEKLGPYMTLAERMGIMLAQLEIGTATEIEVEFAGKFPSLSMGGANPSELEPVFSSVLIGYLKRMTEETPNFVNARALAIEQGIVVSIKHTDESEDYANEIKVTMSDGKRVRSLSGTCFGRQPRITRIRNYRLEIAPEGFALIATNFDQPGVVGKIGSLLGEANVNIASMQLGRDAPGGKALFALGLDARPSDTILETIRAQDFIESAFVVEF
jgi:D-3-phosphoglycerate dehydrogenase / 2-oxoglutarate reductase